MVGAKTDVMEGGHVFLLHMQRISIARIVCHAYTKQILRNNTRNNETVLPHEADSHSSTLYVCSLCILYDCVQT